MTTAATIRTVPIADLIPADDNVRTRDERAETVLENSVDEFGPARSIVVSAGVVRAGNGTLKAFEANGGTEVLLVRPAPGQLVAVVRDDWTPDQARQYAIADNRTAELARWDDTGLAETLRSFQSSDLSLAGVGFDEDEIDALCERLGDEILGDPSGDAAPPKAPMTGRYGVIVECDDEAHQKEVYESLAAEGLNVRVVCV